MSLMVKRWRKLILKEILRARIGVKILLSPKKVPLTLGNVIANCNYHFDYVLPQLKLK